MPHLTHFNPWKENVMVMYMLLYLCLLDTIHLGKIFINNSNMYCVQATFKGWMDIMYAAVDSRDVSSPQTLFAAIRLSMENIGEN